MILLISSLPLVGLFVMGIYSLCLLIMLDEELDARKANDRHGDRNEGQRRQQQRNNIPEPVVVHVEQEVQGTHLAADSERNVPVYQPNSYMPLQDQDLVVEILDVSPEQMEANACVICLDKPKDCVFYPCGHQCLCSGCSERFKREARH